VVNIRYYLAFNWFFDRKLSQNTIRKPFKSTKPVDHFILGSMDAFFYCHACIALGMVCVHQIHTGWGHWSVYPIYFLPIHAPHKSLYSDSLV